MTKEISETNFYTVEFEASPGLWLWSANDDNGRELTKEQAKEISDRCESLGLGCKVYLHIKVESTQLVMERQPA